MTKQRLQEYIWLKKSIKQLEDRIEEIDTILKKTTGTLSDMPRNKTPRDLTNELLAKKIDLQNKLKKRAIKCLIELDEVDSAIANLPQREESIFRLRYLEGKKWEDICLALEYSERQCHRIHGEALKKYGWN